MEKLSKVSPFRLSSLLRQEKNPKLAVQLFLNASTDPSANPKPFRHSHLSYDLIISKLGRAKMFDEMEQILNKLKLETRFFPKEIIFCNVISFYGRAKLPDRALKMFDEIPYFRCERTVKSVNCLLNALLNCGEFDKIKKIFVGISQFANPDVCTYNIMINACCRFGRLVDGWKVIDEMRERGIHPNVVTFGTLIHWLCKDLRLNEALQLKKEMLRVFGLKPDRFVYAPLIKGFCEVDGLTRAVELKQEMIRCKLGLDSVIYTTLISAFFRAGRKLEALEALEEMRKMGCKPGTATYNAVISGFCKDGDLESASRVLDEMVESGCKPDVISYNIILAAFCREGKVKEATELFEDMPRRGCVPDVVSYRILFDGLSDHMQFEEASSILDEMIFKGYAPCYANLQIFVESLCREGYVELVSRILCIMAKANIICLDVWGLVISRVYNKDKASLTSDLVDALLVS
ncbi:Pentatricopeptide repeat [Dillenia turbinata]|uniref:Pentatricopeptide repeat n=1 Tax=Dillenia turbinata TaxID=194707 RepID=A0AAN8VIC5_9MAGN